jgi:hypothetical protein
MAAPPGVDPADPQHILLGPADNVDSRGRIEVTRDGGATWTLASGGLPVPWPQTMVERFVPVGDQVLAVLNEGQLLGATIGQWQWRTLLPEIPAVNAAAVMESA